MDNAFKSLDLYSETKINGKKFQLKKLNIGDFIEFITNYRIMVKLEAVKALKPAWFDGLIWKSALKTCWGIILYKKSLFVGIPTKRMLIDESLKLNSSEKKDNKTDQLMDNNYFQKLIHTLARYYHWSKQDILKLYPEEISLYIDFICDDNMIEAKKESLKMNEFDFMILKPHLTQKGYSQSLNDYKNRRDRIMSGNKTSHIDQERIKKEKAWLESQGMVN